MNSDSQESNNNNNLEKPYQSSKDKIAGEKAAHVAGKGASKRMMPGVGGNLYNASNKTPRGKGFEKMAGRKIENNPQLQASQSLNKSGALDKSNDGNNSALDSVNKTNDSNKNADLEKSSINNSNTSKNGKRRGFGRANGGSSKMSGDVMGNEEDESTQSSFSLFLDFLKKQKFSLSIAGTSIFSLLAIFLVILVILFGILSPTYIAEDLYKYVSDFFEKVENFVTLNGMVTDEEKAAIAKKSFYQKLQSVRESIGRNNDGVQVDVTLIEATLFYNQGMDSELNFTDNSDDDVGNFDETTKFYKEAKKKIKQLAMMQVVKTVTEHECSDPVGSPKMDSRTDKEIAEDYQNQFFQSSLLGNQFATKNNVVYHEYDTVTVTNPDGTESEEEVCNAPDTETIYSLSVAREGIYYYNLISPRNGKSFIEKYYAEELGENYTYDDLVKIVDDIYDLYEYVRKSGSSSYASNYSACPNGVTVIAGSNSSGHVKDPSNYPIGTFDLEEYVGMVVNGENNSGYAEAMRAQIIAARTYTLARTNNCTKPIRNSTEDQVAKANPSEEIKQYVSDTAGLVLTYNGNVFSSEYDSFKGSCSDGTCTGIYTRLPNGEKHTVTIPSKFSEGIGGHGRGMSQCAANYMASTGSTYEQILKFFYSDGVEITKLSGGSSALAVASGNAQEKLAFLFPSGVPTSESQMSQYLATFSVTTVDINGNIVNRNITAHKTLQADLENIFREISSTGFPISDLYCYSWRSMNGSNNRSHHSYGVACDMNVAANPFIKNGEVRAGNKWEPGVNPYSIIPDGPVVKIFNSYGWIWGGNWNSSKDYMHFSFTGN